MTPDESHRQRVKAVRKKDLATLMAPVARDITVDELRAALADIPGHHAVAPVVNGMVGVFQGVLAKSDHDGSTVVLLGEIHTGNVVEGGLDS